MSAASPIELVVKALDPANSVVVAACAGSGKTWLLVSRIVRLLLAGVPPGEILAITFTRHAAQEMAARLREWLELLAGEDDAKVRAFLRERAVAESDIELSLTRGRSLYEEVLRAQPGITISTFHSWYMQLLRSAPLSAGAVGNLVLTEQTSSLVAEAWELFAAACQRDPEGPATRGLDALFSEHGLENTRALLLRFLRHRSDWWAYAGQGEDAVQRALESQRAALGIDPDVDLVDAVFADQALLDDVSAFASLLGRNAAKDQGYGRALADALASRVPSLMFEALTTSLFTGRDELRKRKPSKAQRDRLGEAGEDRLLELHARLGERVTAVKESLADQASYRANAAGLAAGVVLLEAYQRLKRDRQVADFADIEWLAFELLTRSDQAVTLQFKLDSRYRHILLDEFQDTNPLQWLALKHWFEAAAQADSSPVVFLVGDPKQAIYRFRRAEARLFDAARDWLMLNQGAVVLSQDESRRCSQPVLDVVNRLFSEEPAYTFFNAHAAHHGALPGRVEVLALARHLESEAQASASIDGLRNPLLMPLQIQEDLRRESEASSMVARLRDMIERWEIAEDSSGARLRPVRFSDVMVLVQRRTHLQVYERALRQAGIPFTTSRQGGLLDTLEASDLIALLEFLVSPFDDLKLAHALRSPIFGCTDEDLMTVADAPGETWWLRLLALPLAEEAAPLPRARQLLSRWLDRADRLPVHDHLDKIYFEGDVERRYAAAVPQAMRAAVIANLHAFIERALALDSGRYPSLPRFIDELRDMRSAPVDEAPDEGGIDTQGDAIRILTVHGAKGLEAPIVWLLDAGSSRPARRGYEALVDWEPGADAPRDFSLRTRNAESSRLQRRQLQDEQGSDAREDLNLLYVAMTRARQALIVSGCEGNGNARAWYKRVRAAVAAQLGRPDDDGEGALVYGADFERGRRSQPESMIQGDSADGSSSEPGLPRVIPTGSRRQGIEGPGQTYGTAFHRVMECLATDPRADGASIATRAGLAPAEARVCAEQARNLIQSASLRRYFDPQSIERAFNELPLVTETGELRRLDRVVEFRDEVWVLDYKTGRRTDLAGSPLEAEYRAQVVEYCRGLRGVFPDKPVRGALLFTDGTHLEVCE